MSNRISIFDMIEILPTALGDDTNYAQITVLETKMDGPIERSTFRSDHGTVYELAHLDFMFKCSCPARRGVCRHIRAVYPRICVKCMDRSVSKVGDKCGRCEEAEAPYLKPALNRTTTKIGNIRI